jgi:hypothetical protein
MDGKPLCPLRVRHVAAEHRRQQARAEPRRVRLPADIPLGHKPDEFAAQGAAKQQPVRAVGLQQLLGRLVGEGGGAPAGDGLVRAQQRVERVRPCGPGLVPHAKVCVDVAELRGR